MKDRITNKELKAIHSYMDEMSEIGEYSDFLTLLSKLLATFNFLVINGTEWKIKADKYTVLELEHEELKLADKNIRNRLKEKAELWYEEKQDLLNQLEMQEKESERYFNGYKKAIEKCERLEKRIQFLEEKRN